MIQKVERGQETWEPSIRTKQVEVPLQEASEKELLHNRRHRDRDYQGQAEFWQFPRALHKEPR
jgi:hypothetical protein